MEEELETCKHYWVIEPPEGPTSQGVCRLCGIQRTFKNALGDLPFGGSENWTRSKEDSQKKVEEAQEMRNLDSWVRSTGIGGALC